MTLTVDVFPSSSGVGLNIAAFFKNRYTSGKVENLVEFGKPTLEMMPKSDEATGLLTVIPIQLDQPQGMSAVLATAQTNSTSSFGQAWSITLADDYAVLRIDAKTMLASRNNAGSFFRIKEREMDGQLDQLGQRMEMSLWRDGTGSIGQLSADPATATSFTLTNVADAINFHKNMTILFYDNDGSGGGPGTVRAGATRIVSGVNYATGVITVTAALDAALDVSDHVVREGDLNALVKGIPAWIPATDPTDTFFGVPRTLHPQMLGGWRQSWLGSIEETVKSLDASIRSKNQKPKVLFVNYANFNRLEIELGARGMRVEDGEKGVFSRPALMMACPGGSVKVVAGPYVPGNAAYLLDMSTWEILHLGGLPHIVQDDGLTARVIGVGANGTALDGVEIRYRAFWQPVCVNPFANGRAEII